MEYQKRLEKEAALIGPREAPTQPFYLLKDLVTPTDREEIRKFFHQKKETAMASHIVDGSDYDVAVIDQRIVLPELEAKLQKLFPSMMVYRTVYLSGLFARKIEKRRK